MLDLWKDGHIDCKDYAIYNSLKAQEIHAEDIKWHLTKDHVFITFIKDGIMYVADNDKLFKITNYRR